MNFTEERKQFACLIAFYVATMEPSVDHLSLMKIIVDKANDFEFTIDEEGYIDSDNAYDSAYDIAREIADDIDSWRNN